MKNSIQTKAADAFVSFHGYTAAVCKLRNTSAVSIDYRIGGVTTALSAGGFAMIDTTASTSEVEVRRTDLSATPVSVQLDFGLDPDEAYERAVAAAQADAAAVAGLKQGIFNVRDYGAVGNGVADDTDALQAAINAALSVCPAVGSVTSASAGATVRLPAGSYRTTAMLTANGKALIRVVGDGPRVTRIVYDGVSVAAGILKITDSSYCEVSGICLDGGIAFSDFAAANAEALSATKHADYALIFDTCEYVTSRDVDVIGTRKGGVKGLALWESFFENTTMHYLGLSQESGKDGGVWLTNDGIVGRFGASPCNNTRFVKPSLAGEGTLVRIDAADTNFIFFDGLVCEGFQFTTPPTVAAYNKFEVAAGAFAKFSGYLLLHAYESTASDADVFSIGASSRFTSIRDFVIVAQKDGSNTGRPFRYAVNTAAASETNIDNLHIQDTANLIVGAYRMASNSRIVGGITTITEGAGRAATVHVTPGGFDSWLFDGTINIWNGYRNTYRLGSSKMYHGAATTGVENNYEPTAFDDIIFVDTSAGARNINLNVLAILKRRITIKKITGDSNALTITPINGYTLDGVTSMKSVTAAYATVSVYADQGARGWCI